MHTSTSANSRAPQFGVVPTIVLALWAAAIVLITQAGGFLDQGTSLPLSLLPAVLVPAALFLIAYLLLPQLRAWVSRLDLAFVVGVQTFRVIGIVFLFELAQGALPVAFAVPAGLGDIAVGLMALVVTVRLTRDPKGQDGAIRALVLAGFIDFAGAFTFATLSSRGMPFAGTDTALPIAAQTLPASLFPTFFVPVFMIAHIIALIKIARRS